MTINHSYHHRIYVYLGQPSIRALSEVIQLRQMNRDTREINYRSTMKITPLMSAL